MGKTTAAEAPSSANAGPQTKRNMQLVALLSAKKILESEIKELSELPIGLYKLQATHVVVSIAASEVQKAADSEVPNFTTFPMDLAAAFFLRSLPAAERTQARADLFSLFERLNAGDPLAVEQKEELEVTIEAFKKFKKQCGMKPVKGSVRVHAIKQQITAETS